MMTTMTQWRRQVDVNSICQRHLSSARFVWREGAEGWTILQPHSRRSEVLLLKMSSLYVSVLRLKKELKWHYEQNAHRSYVASDYDISLSFRLFARYCPAINSFKMTQSHLTQSWTKVGLLHGFSRLVLFLVSLWLGPPPPPPPLPPPPCTITSRLLTHILIEPEVAAHVWVCVWGGGGGGINIHTSQTSSHKHRK